ncbi:MAG: NlpC/P60 family protein [Acidimicrobiia bacterium]
MTTIEEVLMYSVAQAGDRYQFGAAVDFKNPDPDVFDCSGLVSWACGHAGVKPLLPHGSWLQATHCRSHHLDMDVDEAIATRGALLFKFGATDPFTAATRPEIAHVAWSLGDGTTIEAKGGKWGVGSWTADRVTREWTHGARIPGVDYSAPTRDQKTIIIEDEEEDEMTRVVFYKGAEGEAHPYVVSGCIGKHLSPAALNIYTFAKTPIVGSTAEPLGDEWQGGVALLDGPLRNVPQVDSFA